MEFSGETITLILSVALNFIQGVVLTVGRLYKIIQDAKRKNQASYNALFTIYNILITSPTFEHAKQMAKAEMEKFQKIVSDGEEKE